MRICILSKEYPPDTGWGGIGTFSYHLAHGLQEIGHDVEVVALVGEAKDCRGGLHPSGSPAAENGHGNAIVVHRTPVSVGLDMLGMINRTMPYSHYMLKTNIALWDKFLEIHTKNPFDVVDAPELLAEGVAVALTKTAPLVIRLYTPHSKFIADNLNNVSASFDHQFLAMVERVGMLSAEVLTSPSIDLAKFVSNDLAYPLNDIKIVRNPIDTSKFCPEGQKAIPQNGLNVLFVGRLEERKGVKYLIEAIPEIVRAIPNVHFTIIGDDLYNAKKNYGSNLRKELIKSKCQDKVTWIKRVPLPELASYYRSADVLVAPSLYDNSPYTCLEAMSCGLPVIGTSSGGTSEYVINSESGLIVEPKNASAVAKAVIRVLTDHELRNKLGKNARIRAVANYDRKVIAQEMVETYKQAGEIFATKKTASLYLKDPVNLGSDIKGMLYAYNKTLYNYMYLNSLEFRLKHWSRILFSRPRLTFARILVKAMKVPLRIAKCRLAPVERLESSIYLKDKESEEIARKEVGCY